MNDVDLTYLAKFKRPVPARMFDSVADEIRSVTWDYLCKTISGATLIVALGDRVALLKHLQENGSVAKALEHAEMCLCDAILTAEPEGPFGVGRADGCREN